MKEMWTHSELSKMKGIFVRELCEDIFGVSWRSDFGEIWMRVLFIRELSDRDNKLSSSQYRLEYTTASS